MKKSEFTAAELSAIRNAYDFVDCEMENSTERPANWTLKHFYDVFGDLLPKLRSAEDVEFSHDELITMSFILQQFLEVDSLHGIVNDAPASAPSAAAARKRILSQLFA